MPDPGCLTRDQIDAFLTGALGEKKAKFIRSHLSNCPKCRATAKDRDEQIESSDLLDLLRRPVDVRQYLDEPEFRRALAKAVAIGHRIPLAPSRPTTDQPFENPAHPERLGQYQLLERLGQGGMGIVYKALHTKLQREVVVKLLPFDCMDDASATARFHREMEAVGKLDHPNIVRATDASEMDGTYFLVMEFVDGLDLNQLVVACEPLPTADACELVRQAAMGLQHIHKHGFVHRDIKPSNLMVTSEGVVKVLDLGLARLYGSLADDQKLTISGQIMGTFDYMAPEQWYNAHAVDIHADIYSLGCTLYKLLTSHAPFSSSNYATPLRKMAAHVRKSPPPIQRSRTDVPDDLARVIDRLMAKRPSERYATPAAVAEALWPFTTRSNLILLVDQARKNRTEKVGNESSVSEDGPSASLVATSTHQKTDDRLLSPSLNEPSARPVSDAAGADDLPGFEQTSDVSVCQRLIVTAGPDLGRVFEIQTGELLLVGRGEGCAIQLNDPRTSKIHCRIQAGEGRMRIVDAGSRWGTVVNGQQVTKSELQPDDVITLGATELRVEFVPEAKRGGHQS